VATITPQLTGSLPVSMRNVRIVNPFDYVVVGGGTAGCVVAARLSEDPEVRVLLIEAGRHDGTDAMKVPAKWLTLVGSDVDCGFRTTPQAVLGGAAFAYPRGKVLGGSSGINAMTHLRADRSSYDGGALGWGFEDLLPYFRRAESARGAARSFEAQTVPLPSNPPVTPIRLQRPSLRHARNGAIRSPMISTAGTRRASAGLTGISSTANASQRLTHTCGPYCSAPISPWSRMHW
jgi:choline dehydrogenase-like flavoprotein